MCEELVGSSCERSEASHLACCGVEVLLGGGQLTRDKLLLHQLLLGLHQVLTGLLQPADTTPRQQDHPQVYMIAPAKSKRSGLHDVEFYRSDRRTDLCSFWSRSAVHCSRRGAALSPGRQSGRETDRYR